MNQAPNNQEMSGSETKTPPHAPSAGIRAWPVFLIAAGQLIATVLFSRYGTTNIQNGIALGGIPLAALVLTLVWWLGASKVPWWNRFTGVLLFAGAIAAVLFSQRSVEMGALLLAVALPYMIYGVAVVLAATYPVRWATKRWVLLVMLLCCTMVFCAMRVDSIAGNLRPVTSWRWTPTAVQRSVSLAEFLAQETANVPQTAGEDDWPDFLGANRDGYARGVRFSTDWETEPPQEVWRRPIGPGWSSFIAVGDYLFTQEQRGENELVTCYRADNGAPVWQNSIEAMFEDAMGLGPRATPVFHEGRLYTQGGAGILQCLDAATGETLWLRDVAVDADTRVPGYGFVSSPLVTDGLVVVFTGGDDGSNVIAYHQEDGAVVWQAGRRAAGYCSPQPGVVAGVPQILMASNFGIQAFNIPDGNVLWEHHWDIRTNPRCVQPVVKDNAYVMFGGTGTSGSRLLQVRSADDGWQVEEQWSTRQFRPYFNNGVLYDGHYYGYDGDRLACLDLETGERLWAGERYGGQLLFVEDMALLLVLSESGHVALVRATPERFEEVTRFHALTGKTWNHPIVHRGRLYVRNAEEAACFELPQATTP